MDNETRASWVATATAAVLAWGGLWLRRSRSRKMDAEAEVVKDESVLKQMQTLLNEIRADNKLLRTEVISLRKEVIWLREESHEARLEVAAVREQNREQAIEMGQLSKNHRDCEDKHAVLEAKLAKIIGS